VRLAVWGGGGVQYLERVAAKNDLEFFTYQIRNTLEDAKLKDVIPEEDKTKIQEMVKATIEWVDNNPSAEQEEFEAKKKELQDAWTPIITNAY